MEIFSKLADGKSFILIGSPLSGKFEFIDHYLMHNLKNNEPIIYLSTDKSPEDMKKDMMKRKLFLATFENKDFLKYIDCYSKNAGILAKDNSTIKRISGPLALNEISIAMTKLESQMHAVNPKHRVIFKSLSTLLMYSNPMTVARFLQVLISKIKKSGGGVLFTIEEGMHDLKVLISIEHLMDGIIEIKKEGKEIFVKAQGIGGFEDWTKLSL